MVHLMRRDLGLPDLPAPLFASAGATAAGFGQVAGAGSEPAGMTKPDPKPPVTVGQVVRVAERDFMYGLGELVLRVTAVGDVLHLSDGPWLELTGVQLRHDESVYLPRPRHALVRLSALDRRPPASRR